MTGIKEIPLNSIKSQYLEFSSSKESEGIMLLGHYGNFTESKINAFLKITEETILEEGCKRQIMRRLCSLLVEALQNAYNHSSKDVNGSCHSFLTITTIKDNFILRTGNLIAAEDMVTLDQKLSGINKLSDNELRKVYIETLCNDNFNQKGGAGLGFLTMAKKVKGKIDYELFNVNKQLSYFTLALTIPKD
ncbi:MAG: SiaB family protein kinase [Flavobacteriales bacterium]